MSSISDYNKSLLGNAKAKFKELTFGDKIYYCNPSKVGTIAALTVKEVKPAIKIGWVIITYFKSDQAIEAILKMIEQDEKMHQVTKDLNLLPKASLDLAPTGQLAVEGNADQCFTMSLPPSMYFTNEKAARAFVYTVK